MNIVYQHAESIKEQNPFKRVELAGRLCYNSEDKINEYSAEPFVKALAANGHLTPLEHSRVLIPEEAFKERAYLPNELVKKSCYQRNGFCKLGGYYACTLRALVENGIPLDILKEQGVTTDQTYYTISFITDRGIANECVRHRAEAYDDNGYMAGYMSDSVDEQSMTQQSTRYINYDKKQFSVLLPEPYDYAYDSECAEYKVWYDACSRAYDSYLELLKTLKPQAARDVLPLSTATKVVMSGGVAEWCAFLTLRLPGSAHPRARLLAAQIWHSLKSDGILEHLTNDVILGFNSYALVLLNECDTKRVESIDRGNNG